MVKNKKEEKKKSNWWKWILWIIILLVILNIYGDYRGRWEEENCDLTFNTYTYNDGCASACSVKCGNEGFEYVSSSYFEPYLTVEEMDNLSLYKRCECVCGGCRG